MPNMSLVERLSGCEGVFIVGNAEDLSLKSYMWQHIIKELEKSEGLGAALPVFCPRHPETLDYIHAPGQLPQIAPDGVYESLPNSSTH